MLESSTTPRKRPLAEKELGDELVLYDRRTGRAYFLNLVAGLVWDLCDGTHDAGAIAARIAWQFDRDVAETAPDVAAILHDFRRNGLVDEPHAGAHAGAG